MLGTVAMGLAATTVGIPSLTSCSGKKARRVILYFTGTGNSLYIARQLTHENTELLSIPQLMKAEKFDIEADEIGVYGDDGEKLYEIHTENHNGISPHYHKWSNGGPSGKGDDYARPLTPDMKKLLKNVQDLKK